MRYTFKNDTLRKFGLTDRHLMRKYGGTPGIDALVLETYPECVMVKCYHKDGRRFTILASILQEHGKRESYGHGYQYFAGKELWLVE